ncbi:SET domain-containing protein-lysine N-methyltransferase, partial [Balamuthia mandrillaris]
MRICVLQSSYEGSNSPFSGVDPYSDPASYFKNVKHDHHFEKVLVKKATAAQQIRDLARDGRFDVFINLCDGAFDEDRAGFEVVQLLERYGLAFTGANSKFYEPSKELMKMMAYYYDVNTAPFVFAYNEEDIKEAHQNLRYPMIVKHYNGYSSVGMTKDSRVNNEEELLCQARKMIEDYGGALIEEFIEGREFTVLVAENPDNELEPLVYTPVECKFSNGETFKHFDLKWKEYSGIKWVSCTDEALSQKLKEMSQRIFLALGGVGYGRTDIRVNEAGEAFFLEINPNCGIFYAAPEDDPDALGSADFILINDPTIDHVTFTEHIIQCALKRHARNKQQVAVRFKHGMGYGLFALRDFAEGELVV